MTTVSLPIRALIEIAARPLGIDPDLVEAFVLVESSGQPWAWNPEPHYPWLWNVATHRPYRVTAAEFSEAPPPDFPCLAGDRDQEWWAQQASWGLLQIMGAVAREHGCDVPFLSQLCDPVTNLSVGCRVLQGLLLWAEGDLAKAAAGYNAGRGGWRAPAGQQYAAKVLARLAEVSAARRSV